MDLIKALTEEQHTIIIRGMQRKEFDLDQELEDLDLIFRLTILKERLRR